MKLSKVALWALMIFVISGAVFGAGLVNDLKNTNWEWSAMNLHFGQGETYTINERETDDLAGIQHIRVITNSTNINIVGSGETMSAHLHGTQTTSSEVQKLQLEMTRTDDTLLVEVKSPSNATFGFTSSNVQLDISIPKNYSGKLSTQTNSGNIAAKDMKLNMIDINCKSGNIQMNDVSGTNLIRVKVYSGNARLENILAPQDLVLEATSGNLSVTLAENSQNMMMNCTSGNINLNMASTQNITLKATTQSGKIVSHIDLTDEKKTETSLSGYTGNGSSKIELNVKSGDITLR